jgi:hypothetical protein
VPACAAAPRRGPRGRPGEGRAGPCVCPECKGKEHGCTHCDHKGWMCLDDYHFWKADQDSKLTEKTAATGNK